MESRKLILAINPGSTSTKIAVYNEEEQLFVKNLKHSAEEIAKYDCIADQYEFRKSIVLEEVKAAGFDIRDFKVIVGRGGLVKPISSGVWRVNDAMLEDLKKGVSGQHACNLGGLIAHDIASSLEGVPAIIADPVVVDEMHPLARVSGHPAFPRQSIFHALNQKAIARRYAKDHNKKYEDLNLIVVHLGGGVSVGVHQKGLVIDVNQALDGEGPFSPERTGSLPVNHIINACFSGKYTKEQIKKMIVGEGGFVAYLGTNDAYEVETKAKEGSKEHAFIQSAMAYQVAKEIGAAATVLNGKVDAIILTGGIAKGKPFDDEVIERVKFIAPVEVYAGEDEMGALAMNATMFLNNEIECKEYK